LQFLHGIPAFATLTTNGAAKLVKRGRQALSWLDDAQGDQNICGKVKPFLLLEIG
jgi:hypothetical protein